MAGYSNWVRLRQRNAKRADEPGKFADKILRRLAFTAHNGENDSIEQLIIVAKAKSYGVSDSRIDKTLSCEETEGLADLTVAEFEGKGPDGVSVLVEALTRDADKLQNTLGHVFSQFGGESLEPGSTRYLFKRLGVILLEDVVDEAGLMDISLDAGALEVIGLSGGYMEVLTRPEMFPSVNARLTSAGFCVEHAEVTEVPTSHTELNASAAAKLFMLFDELEALDEVQSVVANADIPDDVLAHLTD